MSPVTCAQTLAINGITLSEDVADGAYQCLDFSPLLDMTVRGSDRTIPYSPGVAPYPRIVDVHHVILPLIVNAELTVTGGAVAIDDQEQNLVDLVLALRTAWAPDAGGVNSDGTFTATWTLPDTSTKSADVHVLWPLQLGRVTPAALSATLDLNVVAGFF